jgi:hypothetical protein
MTDQRYQEIMHGLGMPNNNSLFAALKQVVNEVTQETTGQMAAAVLSAKLFGYVTTDTQGQKVFHSTKPDQYNGTTCVAVVSLADLPKQWSWADGYC